jgi:CheY-like chemotaxis protein
MGVRKAASMEVTISENLHSLLIIEDEGLVSMMIEDMARELGAEDLSVCSDVQNGLSLATSADIDCAVLDIRVRGGNTAQIADILAARGIPFMFSTGGGPDSLPVRHLHRPVISKPFSEDEFKTMLLDTLMLGGGGPSAPPQRVATQMLSE